MSPPAVESRQYRWCALWARVLAGRWYQRYPSRFVWLSPVHLFRSSRECEGNDRPALQLLTVCVVERVHIHRDIEPPDRSANEDIVVLAEVSVCFFQWRTCIGIFFIPCNGVGQRIVVSGVRYSGFYAIDVTTRLPLYLFGKCLCVSSPTEIDYENVVCPHCADCCQHHQHK